MNNTIYCECLECGNEFSIAVPDLLDTDQDAIIGEVVWCGICDSHGYECYWGMFVAGCSSDKIREVLRIWADWANSYRRIQP